MIEDDLLKYFITEEVFILKEAPVYEVPETKALIAEEPAVEIGKKEEALPLHELAIWTPPLTSGDRELLSKMMAAIKKQLSDIHVMEGVGAYSPAYRQLICFGYQQELEEKLKSRQALYRPVQVENQQILISIALADLHASKADKTKLWEALQIMFLQA